MAKELREALGPLEKKNVYDKDLPDEIKMELWRQFRAVLEVLRDAGKLGAVHMQFAPWVAFHPIPSTISNTAGQCWRGSPWLWNSATRPGSTSTSTHPARWL